MIKEISYFLYLYCQRQNKADVNKIKTGRQTRKKCPHHLHNWQRSRLYRGHEYDFLYGQDCLTLASLAHGSFTMRQQVVYEATGQGHTEVMTACSCDISPHGDTLMCQISYDYAKGQKSCGPNTKPCQKKTLKSKVNIVLESWMFATHPL